MKRRTALKVLGGFIVMLAGKPVEANQATLSEGLIFKDIALEPVDYIIESKNIKNLIIQTEKEKITIPFSDIIDALKN